MDRLPVKMISSGTFFCCRNESSILRAFLGTCVGVAIYDETTRVGGLIHILLPESAIPGSTFQVEKYARTGIPKFLDALYAKGASREHMKAAIAGGALIGPVSKQDIDLDIGGRTAEVAKNLLASEGIETDASETGGFYATTLSLNAETGEFRIDPIGFDRVSDGPEFDPPTSGDINRCIDAIKPIPQIALKILRLMEDEFYSIDEIAAEVRKDQVISARTIQLCNSPLFAFRDKTLSLEKAIVLLGERTFLNMIVSAAVTEYFGDAGHGYSLCKGGDLSSLRRHRDHC